MYCLPHVDEHSIRVDATVERAWEAVIGFVRRRLSRPAPSLFVALWDLSPSSGFAIEDEAAPRHVALRGHHRFSRYELSFDVEPVSSGVSVTARTAAEFPGLAGRAYRALVIGSGGHAIVMRRMLKSIARRAERAS